jgi:hypothetical protein
MLKAQLAVQIYRSIKEKGWTLAEAADDAVGLVQPKMS